ncbi:MAG: 16S rRNA (guanine(527)-N(7))-methyltransferase RsmG [Pseudomonadota bacterium]
MTAALADEITSADAFARQFSVSSETIEKLETYAAKLRTWQKAVNLVAPKTLDSVWHRHFADSAQLLPLIPDSATTLADLGSGAGFPGLVIAILATEQRPDLSVTLVESDTRKAAFLSDVARAVENPCRILSTRIEASSTVAALGSVDCVTARALASSSQLLAYLAPIAHASTVGIFPKGRTFARELADAKEAWDFDLALVPSLTDAESRIAVISHLRSRRQEGPNAHDNSG